MLRFVMIAVGALVAASSSPFAQDSAGKRPSALKEYILERGDSVPAEHKPSECPLLVDEFELTFLKIEEGKAKFRALGRNHLVSIGSKNWEQFEVFLKETPGELFCAFRFRVLEILADGRIRIVGAFRVFPPKLSAPTAIINL